MPGAPIRSCWPGAGRQCLGRQVGTACPELSPAWHSKHSCAAALRHHALGSLKPDTRPTKRPDVILATSVVAGVMVCACRDPSRPAAQLTTQGQVWTLAMTWLQQGLLAGMDDGSLQHLAFLGKDSGPTTQAFTCVSTFDVEVCPSLLSGLPHAELAAAGPAGRHGRRQPAASGLPGQGQRSHHAGLHVRPFLDSRISVFKTCCLRCHLQTGTARHLAFCSSRNCST